MKKVSKSNLRALIRSLTILVTAFGLKLSGEQVAAIQLVVESAMRLVYSRRES